MQDVAADEIHHAGCACGAVRMRTTGRPLRAGLCHCFDCRKAHAAPFAAFLAFPAASVRVLDAADADINPATLGVWNNGRGYRRYFCTSCGSRLFGLDDDPSEIELHLGLFDETNVWQPDYELWTKRRETWLGHLPTIRTRYDEDRHGGNGT